MKNIFRIWSLLLFSFPVFSQITVDTLIDKGIYQSFFSYTLKEPLYVTYILYKGGGDCSRDGMSFKSGGVPNSAKDADYLHSGYDKGHLANAEDFASSCSKEELTFRYYNCVPQTSKLNKGIWKTWETSIRDESQTKKLFIIAGNIFKSKRIGKGKIGVPDQCYKIVLEFKTKKLLHCLIFKNDDSDEFNELSLSALRKMIKYPLMPAAYWKSK